jgi:hypothetical protein
MQKEEICLKSESEVLNVVDRCVMVKAVLTGMWRFGSETSLCLPKTGHSRTGQK